MALLSVTQGSINIEVRMLLPLDPLDTNGTAAHEILKALQNANVSALSEALGVELLSINSPALVSQAAAPPPPAPFIVLSTLSDEVKKFMDTFLAGTFIVTLIWAMYVGGVSSALPMLFALQRGVLMATLPVLLCHPTARQLGSEMLWVLGNFNIANRFFRDMEGSFVDAMVQRRAPTLGVNATILINATEISSEYDSGQRSSPPPAN